MRKLLPVLFFLVLVTLGGLGYKLWENQQDLKSSEGQNAELQRKLQEEQAEKERLEQERLTLLDKAVLQESERQRIQAQQAEAQRLAEERNRKQQEEKERNIALLNARLKKEAEARKEIEKQLLLLQEEREKLAQAQAEAEEKAKLAQQQSATDRSETDAALAAVEAQQAEIRRVEEKQIELDRLYAEAEKRQLATEAEIQSQGGVIDPSLHSLRSINYKRREHFYLRQQMENRGM